MGTTVSRGFGALALSVALVASNVAAQAESAVSRDIRPAQASNAPAVVSVDVLRHPITTKVRQMLLRAMATMESGDHETAIEQLLEMLGKYPDSAPYVHNLLGVEYVKTDRFDAAVGSFQQAVLLLPHDAMTHYNFGLALICAGDYERATQEVERALELDPRNPQMQARLDALLEHKRSGN